MSFMLKAVRSALRVYGYIQTQNPGLAALLDLQSSQG
jgi:hypothetical protein